jgi:hypothetical protein
MAKDPHFQYNEWTPYADVSCSDCHGYGMLTDRRRQWRCHCTVWPNSYGVTPAGIQAWIDQRHKERWGYILSPSRDEHQHQRKQALAGPDYQLPAWGRATAVVPGGGQVTPTEPEPPKLTEPIEQVPEAGDKTWCCQSERCTCGANIYEIDGSLVQFTLLMEKPDGTAPPEEEDQLG